MLLACFPIRFTVSLTQINLEPKKVETVVLACLALHNLLRKTSPETVSHLTDREDQEIVPSFMEIGGNKGIYWIYNPLLEILHRRQRLFAYNIVITLTMKEQSLGRIIFLNHHFVVYIQYLLLYVEDINCFN